MPSHSERPGIRLSVWRFLLTHCLYERAAKVLARLRGCAGSPEPSLLAQALSTKFAWRGPAWFQYTRYICPLSTCVPSFNLLALTIPEKSVMNNFNVWKLEKEKWRNKGMNKQSRLITSTHCPRVYQVSTLYASQFLRKEWQKFLMFENWRERKLKK